MSLFSFIRKKTEDPIQKALDDLNYMRNHFSVFPKATYDHAIQMLKDGEIYRKIAEAKTEGADIEPITYFSYMFCHKIPELFIRTGNEEYISWFTHCMNNLIRYKYEVNGKQLVTEQDFQNEILKMRAMNAVQ